jgi:hypothetical protein
MEYNLNENKSENSLHMSIEKCKFVDVSLI